MADPSKIELAFPDIATRIEAEKKRVQQARNAVNTAITELTNLGDDYTAMVTEINTAAGQGNVAAQNYKARLDPLVSQFSAYKTAVQALKAAMDGVQT